jgi:CDP-2,3-bis-(O-geranylgeranyl)-sn-glycerol synthase
VPLEPAPGTVAEVLRLAELVYLILPAYMANMAAPFSKYFGAWNRPISRRWLGSHKTVVGFVLGILAALATAFAQSRIQWEGSLVPYWNWPVLGLLLGAGALLGDAVKSLLKRARGIPPGRSWIPADQLDFVIGALVVIWPRVRLGWQDVAILLTFSFIADIAVNRVAYRLGVRDTPW